MSVHCNHLLSDPVPGATVKAEGPFKTRRVLVVSYDFPPNRTSAVYRMTGLTKYLLQFGWQSTVLTIRGEEGPQEPALLEKLPPEVNVERTRFLRINAWETPAAHAIAEAGVLHVQAKPGSRERRFDRYLRWGANLLRSTLYFPDDTVGWVPFGLSKAIELHRRQPFDAVYATSPPRSSLIIGLLMKMLFGIPWVFELMDPWYPSKGKLRRKSDDWLQSFLLHKADRIVVMVRNHAEELSRSFNVPAEKICVVRNGFFEEDFADTERTEPPLLDPAFLHLSHFGTIYPENYGNFFVALTELVDESPELHGWLRVNICGHPCESIRQYASQGSLKDIIEMRGFDPDRTHILRMMRASHCLLLFWGRADFSRLAMPGKTYDYLRVGRPILALTQEGGVKDMIEEARAGWAVPPGDTAAIKQALRLAIDSQQPKGLPSPPRPELVAQFRWDQLAENLAGVLEGAVNSAR